MQPLSTDLYSRLDTDHFKNLRVLALNQCGLTSWAEVLLLSKCFSGLEELYLNCNDLSDISTYGGAAVDLPTTVFSGLSVQPLAPAPASQEVALQVLPQLTVLDVSHCKIASWSSIQQMMRAAGPDCGSAMPALTDLLLDGNPLPCIGRCPSPDPAVFPHIQRLSASSTG